MTSNRFDEKLEWFKQREKPEALLLVADSSPLLKIAVAWLGVPLKRRRRLTRLTAVKEEEIWMWLWENVQYDLDDLLARIPNADSSTTKKVKSLIANRILYPDGSVNSFVERLLRERVVKQFSHSYRAATSP